ncbi:terminase [Virgibacillus sp. 7505]|uniref:terminase small subunit n=1 Tax=Virgibacillus sp. 7505 TaxID=2022548 RepID=UPI000BA6B2B5|nr:terminase small subunit [Virgibacillus sp. 7505]PAE17279.1 terminase [Virgibacillus sp. 7505]
MDWNTVREEYETSDITLKALAEKHDIKLGTLKSRKSREGWSRDATPAKKVATPKKKDATKKEMQPEELVPEIDEDGLTNKQQLFCIYYVKSFNATQSAIKAGYSPDTAHVQGSRLLKNDKIAAEIRRIKQDLTDSLFIDAQDVLAKYAAIAFADITDFTTFGKKEVEVMGMFGPVEDEDGNVMMKEVNYVDFKESNMIDGTIITEVKQGKDGVAIKMADKMKALDVLTKYFELLPDSYKRRLAEEKMQLEKDRFAFDKAKANLDDDEYEDDGFMDALDKAAEGAWDDDGDDGSNTEAEEA